MRVLQVVDLSISGPAPGARARRPRRSPAPSHRLRQQSRTDKQGHLLPGARDEREAAHFIQPGEPTQNAFVESFNGKFRENCLGLHWFSSLEDVRAIIDTWRTHYNQVRPHRSLGRKPPAVFARKVARDALVPAFGVARIKGYGHPTAATVAWMWRFTVWPAIEKMRAFLRGRPRRASSGSGR